MKFANSITDIGGIKIGHAHDARVKTGVSVLIPDQPALCAVDVRGGGPGTRETDALGASNLVDRVHAIVLSGGSVYGLAAADRVCAILGTQGIGYAPAPHLPLGQVPVSPIVPSAILFDNANGGDKAWGDNPPFADLAAQAMQNLSTDRRNGSVGAGFGATAGIYAGGLGSVSETVGVGGTTYIVGAMIAANPVGSPFMPNTDCFWAWPFEQNKEYGGKRPPADYRYGAPSDTKLSHLSAAGAATVIGAVATNAPLTQKQLRRMAMMAQDGIAMAVQPSHTPLDGDTIFALSTVQATLDLSPVALADLGAAAARCVARALSLGIHTAMSK